MQRPDAYTAADKLTKPVWLVILGGRRAAGLRDGARLHRIRDRGRGRRRLSRRRPAENPGDPGKVALVACASVFAAAVAAASCPWPWLPCVGRPRGPARRCRPHRMGALGRPVQLARLPDCGRPCRSRATGHRTPERRCLGRGDRVGAGCRHPWHACSVPVSLAVAEFAEPGKTAGISSRGETSVDGATMIEAGCNPGGTEEPF